MHNKKVTKAKPSAQVRTGNCINKSKYSLNNGCLSNKFLYKANITSTTENYRNKFTMVSARPSSSQEMQTIENL